MNPKKGAMLPISIAVIVVGSIFLILKAPTELRLTATLLVTLPAAAGYGLGFFLATDDDTATYYPIAAAIGGWIIGAAIYDSRRKKRK